MPTRSTADAVETAAEAIRALLSAIERTATAGAAKAYRAAITRHGRCLIDSLGIEALLPVFERIRTNAPNQAAADARVAIVLAAWEDFAKEGRAA